MDQSFIRNGDILLTRVDSLPEGETIQHDGSYVLAYGEVTGHRHLLTATKPEALTIRRAFNVIYLSLTIPMPLTHEEHKRLEIPPGIYRVGQEQEYSYCDMEMRKVVD